MDRDLLDNHVPIDEVSNVIEVVSDGIGSKIEVFCEEEAKDKKDQPHLGENHDCHEKVECAEQLLIKPCSFEDKFVNVSSSESVFTLVDTFYRSRFSSVSCPTDSHQVCCIFEKKPVIATLEKRLVKQSVNDLISRDENIEFVENISESVSTIPELEQDIVGIVETNYSSTLFLGDSEINLETKSTLNLDHHYVKEQSASFSIEHGSERNYVVDEELEQSGPAQSAIEDNSENLFPFKEKEDDECFINKISDSCESLVEILSEDKVFEVDPCIENQLSVLNTTSSFQEIFYTTNSDAEHFIAKSSRLDDFSRNRFLNTSACSTVDTNTTQVVKSHLTFPYDHETYFTICPVPTTSCHSSFYSNCRIRSLISGNNLYSVDKYNPKYSSTPGDDIAHRLSGNETCVGSKSIYTVATSDSKYNTRTSSGIVVNIDSNNQSEHFQSDKFYSKVGCDDVSAHPIEKEALHFICDNDIEMGSKNSINERNVSECGVDNVCFENKEETYLSEFPPDRSDGSDSGLGSEIVDERITLRSESQSSDEVDGGSASNWSSVQAVPSTSKQLRVIRSSLKRPHNGEQGCSVAKKTKRSIEFENVSIFYFPRTQGFTCVPSQGGSTLGMSWNHSHAQTFTLSEHAAEQRRLHRHLVAQLRATSNNAITSSSSDSDTDEQPSESEPDSNYYFLQPVPTRQRRAMLRAAGVHKIDSVEKDECRDIRTSREFCGCACKGYCDPDTCACSLDGIKCQVDRLNFPCGCTRDGCANSSGRIEFNPVRVRTHFIHTLMRLDLEKKRAQEDEEAAQRQQVNRDNAEAYSQSGGFPNFPYRSSLYGYQMYDSSGSTFSYGYSGYLPTYDHSDVSDFVSSGLEFHQSSYQSFPTHVSFPQVEANQNTNNETKLESFSELLQGRYTEAGTSLISSEQTVTTGSDSQEKTTQNVEECQSDNFGEIIKKTMVESASS